MAQERIVILSDDEELCQEVETMLSEWGYAMMASPNLTDAVLSGISFRPQLYLIDWSSGEDDMLEMGWTEMCGKLRTRPDSHMTPILMIVGSVSLEEVEDGLRNGVDDYVLKPIQQSELLQKVSDMLKLAQEGRLPSQIKAEMGEQQTLERAEELYETDGANGEDILF